MIIFKEMKRNGGEGGRGVDGLEEGKGNSERGTERQEQSRKAERPRGKRTEGDGLEGCYGVHGWIVRWRDGIMRK
jgi:hypothetical protein